MTKAVDASAAVKKNPFPALLFATAVFIPVFLAARSIAGKELLAVFPALWALFTALTAFFILHTGRVSFYRRIFFSALAVFFFIHFKLSLFSGIFAPSCFKDTPYCHIAIAPSFFNYLYQQYLAAMSGDWRLWGPFSLAFLWLFFTLVIGRAWCSWACFYGGIDDGLSALPKKPLFKTDRFAGRFRHFPAVLLIFLLLVSLAYMLPVYCLWLCPLKLTAQFLEPDDSFIRKVQLGLMFFALAALAAGPLLTKKRTFCSFLCPFAAWQAFWGRINPFRVSIDEAACTGCGVCVESCPVFAINIGASGRAGGSSGEAGLVPQSGSEIRRISAYCNLCGECLPACPQGAIGYSILGKAGYAGTGFGRLLSTESWFVFSALVTGGAFGALFAPAALNDLAQIILK